MMKRQLFHSKNVYEIVKIIMLEHASSDNDYRVALLPRRCKPAKETIPGSLKSIGQF